MAPQPTPAPRLAGVTISTKHGIIILLILVVLIALFGRNTTAPAPVAPPAPAPAADSMLTAQPDTSNAAPARSLSPGQ